jgi:hypothetical protein
MRDQIFWEFAKRGKMIRRCIKSILCAFEVLSQGLRILLPLLDFVTFLPFCHIAIFWDDELFLFQFVEIKYSAVSQSVKIKCVFDLLSLLPQ